MVACKKSGDGWEPSGLGVTHAGRDQNRGDDGRGDDVVTYVSPDGATHRSVHRRPPAIILDCRQGGGAVPKVLFRMTKRLLVWEPRTFSPTGRWRQSSSSTVKPSRRVGGLLAFAGGMALLVMDEGERAVHDHDDEDGHTQLRHARHEGQASGYPQHEGEEVCHRRRQPDPGGARSDGRAARWARPRPGGRPPPR